MSRAARTAARPRARAARYSIWLLGLALALASAHAHARERIRIGWTAWSDGVFVTRLAEHLIETRLDQPVQLVRAGIAEQYQGLASGRIDVTLMSWQPRTHGPYLRRVSGHVEDLGVLYDGARLGWAVPDYVPEDALGSIADLRDPEVARRVGRRIVGIDPGAGLMRLSRRALSRYGLDAYELEPGSGPAMTGTLERALADREWIVVTGWSPHWMFAAHDLRYLRDPEGVLGGPEQVHALAGIGFYARHPRAARLLSRMWLPLDELEQALLRASETSYERAVREYVEQHPARVAYWLEGAAPETQPQ